MIQLAGGVPPSSAFAYNNGGAPATFSGSDTFTFSSAWLATDGSSPMTVEVVGLLGGKVVDRTMLVLSSPVPIQETFNWQESTACALYRRHRPARTASCNLLSARW